MPLKFPVLTLAAALAFSPLAARAVDDAAFLVATQLLQKAESSGEEGAIVAAVERWRALAAAEPAHPVLKAYAGSAVSMQANTTLLPWRKMAFAEDGLAMIDKALAQLGPEHDSQRLAGTPASLLVRFTAASTFLALPSMFNRGARGEDQLQAVLKHAGFDGASLGFKGAVWLRAGQQAAKEGRKDPARKFYEQLLAAKAPQAAVAQKLLAGL